MRHNVPLEPAGELPRIGWSFCLHLVSWKRTIRSSKGTFCAGTPVSVRVLHPYIIIDGAFDSELTEPVGKYVVGTGVT